MKQVLILPKEVIKIKKYKIYKNGKTIHEGYFSSMDKIANFIKNKFGDGKYEIQQMSLYKENDVKEITVK